jgi:phosphoglycerate-specific signal transduction histidine kinase
MAWCLVETQEQQQQQQLYQHLTGILVFSETVDAE